MTETRDLSLFVKRDADGISHMDLAVEGVGCAGCIRKSGGITWIASSSATAFPATTGIGPWPTRACCGISHRASTGISNPRTFAT